MHAIDNQEIQIGSEWVLRTDPQQKVQVTRLALSDNGGFVASVWEPAGVTGRVTESDVASAQFGQHEFREKYTRIDFADYERSLHQCAKELQHKSYWDDVRGTADSIIKELNAQFLDGRSDEDVREWLLEHIHETIDGAHRVIYTYAAKECLLFSDNDGAYFEEYGSEGAVEYGCIMWSRLAFAAFERDVIEQLDAEGVDVNEPVPDQETVKSWLAKLEPSKLVALGREALDEPPIETGGISLEELTLEALADAYAAEGVSWEDLTG